MNADALLARLAAAPKQWRCVSVFSDGVVRNCDQPTQAMAEAHAKRQRRFIGKPAMHDNGKPVTDKNGKPVTLDIVTVHRI